LETIRYYERIGLLPPPGRSAAGYRAYDQPDVERLQFVVRSRALGFALEDVRSLLALASSTDMSCEDVDVVARAHLDQIEVKQRELSALAGELRTMIETCRHGTRATCTVLRSLAG
jgi:MerR family mercuric resistance operon transcriptional regulator